MKTKMVGVMPMVLLATALAASLQPQRAAGESLCNYRSATYAKLDPADFAGCMKLRTKGVAADDSPIVWSLTDQSVFSTVCPIQIAVPTEAHATACSNVADEALKPGDSVRIDEWGADKLELVILRAGTSVFHTDQPRVFLKPATVKLGDEIHTIGYFADALVYATPARPSKPIAASYYVYLADTVQNGIPVRWYQIEVFESSKKCRAEIPGSHEAGTETMDCGAKPNKVPVRLRGQAGPLQLPIGGGGEPPPTPPG